MCAGEISVTNVKPLVKIMPLAIPPTKWPTYMSWKYGEITFKFSLTCECRRLDGFHAISNQLRHVGKTVNNIETFLPRTSTMNMERKHPMAVPSFNKDTIQKASLP
ncbi:unnamed protein product, partial [Heterotrigona itama]